MHQYTSLTYVTIKWNQALEQIIQQQQHHKDIANMLSISFAPLFWGTLMVFCYSQVR